MQKLNLFTAKCTLLDVGIQAIEIKVNAIQCTIYTFFSQDSLN